MAPMGYRSNRVNFHAPPFHAHSLSNSQRRRVGPPTALIYQLKNLVDTGANVVIAIFCGMV